MIPPRLTMEKLNITQWAEEDRPREKLMRLGAEALTNAELLAILIGSGSPEETAVELMKRVLGDCNNNLNTLGKKSISELTDARYKGLGPAKAITILAACELGKRRQSEKAEERQRMDSAEAIYEYMRPKMQDLATEQAWVLLLNQNFKLIKTVRISSGGISETSVDVRVVALCHNHPSNNPRPSGDDDRITQRLQKACDTMRIYMLDHLVITDSDYYSYMENGKLDR